MTYNIHPIFVHIPIAFLAVYSIITIIPFHKFLPRIMWRDVRLIILIAGVIGAFFALSTGELAEHLVKPNHNIVETHALFASLSTWLYAILLLGEISAWYNRVFPEKKFMKSLSLWVTYILYNFYTRIVLSIIAFVCITITGILGGVMVYGTTSDPIAPIILNLLGL